MNVLCKTVFATSALAVAFPGLQTYAQKPNVIFILTDDQGYGDLGCNGNPWIHTPNIDLLERESFSFTDYHSNTSSAPTRAGLMTGQYCNSVGVWHTVNGRSLLSLDSKIMPQVFKEGGYATGMFGKWHLGDNYPYRPHDRGFDEAFFNGGGGVGQVQDHWANNYLDDTYQRNDHLEKAEGYCTDVWFSEAMKFIDEHKTSPFFVYLSTNAPHGPFNVEKKYSDLYKGNENIPNPNFYGMITNIDQNVGKLIKYLKDEGLYENTILVYMTDNGTDGGVRFNRKGQLIKGFNAYMSGKKGGIYEGGHRVPFIMRVPGHKPKKIHSLTGYIDVLPTFLDLCGLSHLTPKNIDGQSLVPMLDKDDELERCLFVDTQCSERLHKGYASVMYKKWRLLKGQFLYNVLSDPAQKENIAERFPDLVKKMSQEYDKWWERTATKRANVYEPIWVGAPQCEKILLYCSDLHNDRSRIPAWHQRHIRQAGKNNGYWALDVKKKGTYKVRFYRWDPATDLALNAKAPAKDENWGNLEHLKEGVAITDIKTMEVFVDRKLVKRAKVKDSKKYVEVTLNLDEGQCLLQGDFVRATKDRFSAYYATMELCE